MSDPLQEQLLGHLLGALDEAEEEQIVARLRSDPELRRELARVRRQLEVLELGRDDFPPPAGLAERTCRAVALHVESTATVRRRSMSPVAAGPASGDRFRWIDVAAAAGILAAASLLVVPAIQSSRFNAQLLACQDNLRQVGVGMIDYSQYHDGYFPSLTLRDKLRAAAICAPLLIREGFVTERRRFICPASPGEDQSGLRSSIGDWQTASREGIEGLRRWIGESYAFHLGFIRGGVCYGTRNLGRAYFALGSDVPDTDPSNGRQSLNHGGFGQNVLLESGAVKWFTSSRLFPQGDDIFTNQWGLIGPGVGLDDSVIARPLGLLLAQ